ncbi:MAG: phage tail tape measure protein [Candidatus Aminicenantes bacterium]|nr:phage tail tape measure protein [Candidatus Aminicenantes bacterium]
MNNTDTIALRISVKDDGSVVVHGFKDKVQKSLGGVSKSAKSASGQMMDFMKNTLKFTVGFQAMTGVLQKGRQAITDIWNESTRFDTEWRNVTTMIEDSTVDLAGMRGELLKMAGPLGGASELAKSLWLVLSSNVKPQKALYALREAAIAAKGGAADLFKVVDIGTTIINTYGLEVESLPYVYDQLFETNRRAKTSISELSMSMGESIGTFSTVGGSFAEMNAYIVAMTLSGVKTRKSMTALNAVIANIARPTTEAAERAEELGIEFSATALKAKGFAGFMGEVTEKVQGNIEAQVDLFGSIDAFNAMSILASEQGMARYTDALKGMENASGNTKKAFDKQMLAFSNVMTGLKNEVSAMFIEHLTPFIKTMSEWLAKNQESISKFINSTISGIKSVLEYFSPIGDVIVFMGKTIKSVVGIIWNFKDEIIFAGKAFLLYFAATKIQAWGSAFLGVLGGVGGGFKGLTGNVQRFVDIYRMQGMFGHSKMESIGHAAEMSGVKTGKLFKKTTALKGVLSNLAPVAVAAFVGWKIGEQIEKIGVVKKAAQGLFDFLLAGSMKFQEEFSQILHMSEAQADDASRRENVLELAAAHGILAESYKATGYNLKAVYIALGQNTAAYAQLDGATKKIVDRFSAQNTKLQEHQEQLRQVKEITEQYRGEIYESIQVHLRLLGLPVPSWMELTRKATERAGGAAADAKKKFEDYAASLGIVTKKGYGELRAETRQLIQATRLYSDQLESNKELQEKVWGKSAQLMAKYYQAGKPIPGQLQVIHDRLRNIIGDRDNLRKAGIFEVMAGGMGTFIGGLGSAIDLMVDYQDEWKAAKKYAAEHYAEIYEILRIQMHMLGLPMPDIFSPDKLREVSEGAEKIEEAYYGVSNSISLICGLMDMANSKSSQALNGISEFAGGFAGVLSGNFTGAIGMFAGFTKVMEAIGQQDWGARAEARLEGLAGVTKEMKEQLAAAAEEANSTSQAMAETLDIMIEMAEISSHSGFSGWAGEVENLMGRLDWMMPYIENALNQGIELDIMEVTPEMAGVIGDMDDSFSALVEKARELGFEGSASMLSIMEKAREFKAGGIEIGSVFQYIDEQFADYGQNYQKYVEGITGEKSFNRAIQHGAALIDAMQADGYSMLEILDVIGPGLESLMEKATAQGWEITGMSDMLGLQTFVTDNEAALGQLDLSMSMMQSLGNIGRLTQEQFGLYQDELYESYKKIAEGEKYSQEALLSIAPYLQQQVWLSEQYGYSLDDRTKKLIEAAEQEGVNLDAYKTQEQLQTEMNDNFVAMNDNLSQLVDIMGALTGATADYGNAWAGASGNMDAALRTAQGFSRIDLGGGSFDYLLPELRQGGRESQRGIPGQSTPDYYAATGYRELLTGPTDILIGNTHVLAGEAGKELLSITPVDQVNPPRIDLDTIDLAPIRLPARSSAGSAASASGGTKIELKIEMKVEAPIYIQGDGGGIDYEELRVKSEEILENNLRGFSDKLERKIEELIDRRLPG